jgi:exodeoxyribonuclease VII small subunit
LETNKELNFEDSLRRLQEISEKLESKEISLDESIKLYEEGIRLAKECYRILNEAELKITKLKEDLDKEFSEEDV